MIIIILINIFLTLSIITYLIINPNIILKVYLTYLKIHHKMSTNTKCNYIVERGKSKGNACERTAKINGFCHKHIGSKQARAASPQQEIKKIEPEVITCDSIFKKWQDKEDNIDYPLNIEGIDLQLTPEQIAEKIEERAAPEYSDKFKKKFLTNINLFLFQTLEDFSKMNERTDMTGLAADVKSDEDLYEEALWALYLEHQDEIDGYLSPAALYFALVAKTTGTRYTKNHLLK